MNIFRSLKLQFRPPKMADPDFGQLTFMYISNHPERSHWEAEWTFPPTATPVGIALRGDKSGPRPEVRQWYLSLPPRFPWILESVRAELTDVFRSWLDRDLPEDIWSVVRLTGFGVDDPRAVPVHWDVWFETTGDKWLSITIPFVGDEVSAAIIDT